MNDHEFLNFQKAQLDRLLKESQGHDFIAEQLGQRIDAVQTEIDYSGATIDALQSAQSPPPRVALFLKGGGVQGTTGVRASLAGESLIQYERMFAEQALFHERSAARETGRSRRPRGSQTPSLLFIGTPRGSFGLEFVPQPGSDGTVISVHTQALREITNVLETVSSEDPTADSEIAGISPRVFQPMKKFLNTLVNYGAELRIAFSDRPSSVISSQRIRIASERLEREVQSEEIELKGKFRGLTRETTVFDLLLDDGSLITGSAAEGLTEPDLDRISALTNHRCVATLEKTTLTPVGGPVRVTYLLIDAEAENAMGENSSS